MYKKKYYKYKNKYLELLKEKMYGGYSDDPDTVNAYDRLTVEYISPEEEYGMEKDDDEIRDIINLMMINRDNFIGFDKDPGFDVITNNLNNNIVDIGIFGKARGKLIEPYRINENEYITIDSKKDKNKILRIDTESDFDKFTIKYGVFDRQKERMFIKWDKVANNYKGILISSTSQANRGNKTYYFVPGYKTGDNWVHYDFNYLDRVVLFKKKRKLMYFDRVNNPFDAIVVDEYAINEDDFVRLEDVGPDKVLIIENVKDFDKFTNRYGYLREGVEGNIYIDINWNMVSDDYDGIYIDKDNIFKKDRYERAFYDGEKYSSWWKYNRFNSSNVYIFT